MIIIKNKQEKELVESFRKLAGKDEIGDRLKEINNLKKEINDLKIDKDLIQEKHAKEERELRHMIGLEKKRQEFEIESAKKQTELLVREENLKEDKKRFEEHLKFNTDRFEAAAKDQKELLAEIIKRLPNVNMEVKRR